jgi:hypothetical protein
MASSKLTKEMIEKEIKKRIAKPAALEDWLHAHIPFIVGPKITCFDPIEGQPGCLVTIQGSNFAANRTDNEVRIGGQPAQVVNALPNELKAITHAGILNGPVKVKVGTKTASGPHDFKVLGYPSAGDGEDGPPIAYTGIAAGPGSGDVDPIGTIRVLVALVRPNDLAVPAAAVRNNVVSTWNDVRTYYTQASYTKTDVQVDMTTNWAVLDGPKSDFIRTTTNTVSAWNNGTGTISITLADTDGFLPGMGVIGMTSGAAGIIQSVDPASIVLSYFFGDFQGGERLEQDQIDETQLDRIMAQAAQGAVNEGFNLNDYAMMACVMFLDGSFVRAWGNWSTSDFSYSNGLPVGDPNRIAINLPTSHDISLVAIQETADWGRCAHEFGHNIVSAPNFLGDGTATLGEDIYSSDLVDPDAASATEFDIMGSTGKHALFSGYHLDKIGYYKRDPAIAGDVENVAELTWDRNPTTRDFDIVAHGVAKNGLNTRVHLVKLKVTDGLHYFIQVRQRPGPTTQIFDDDIPLNGAANQGGVIVTRAIADTLHINQQTRFITLMHPENVLKQGDIVEDPARQIRISVINDNVQARPLVCRVRVEWANTIADDPNGSFDLNIEGWDGNYQTPDIWVDRSPFGVYDNSLDADGRPTGNGDRPRPGQINRLYARTHVSGAMGAQNVLVTFYAVFPPGVGDNGNWSPLATQLIPAISQNGWVDATVNWVPIVGEHTCLKVYAGRQLGEVSGGNNSAQENVFEFESPAGSPGEPVFIPTAVRNPLNERKMIRVAVHGVPKGWSVYFPHSWVWLDGLAEKRFDLIVVPDKDFSWYQEMKLAMVANVRITGTLARNYSEPLPPKMEPSGSRFYPIGGVLNKVRLLKKSHITLQEDQEHEKKRIIALRGDIIPAHGNQRVRVELIDPKGALRVREVKTNATGHYMASFDLHYIPSLEEDKKKWKATKKVVAGVYRAQAFIFAADYSAGATSNMLFITL